MQEVGELETKEVRGGRAFTGKGDLVGGGKGGEHRGVKSIRPVDTWIRRGKSRYNRGWGEGGRGVDEGFRGLLKRGKRKRETSLKGV